ncbi:hypothetical protein [Salipiger sp. PrR003]|uniref:hypothetical protein n=1 Tax=Salipiger sp. PrR003 TaxID=2706776 RepID=UPI0013DD7F91|nr:hypothetical protein [Salipiger sp. PrR003]NDV50119.1 hypothetical protein [Salipiger sp. PrR003]
MVKFPGSEVVDRLLRFFDVAVISFTVMSADRPEGAPTPMARLGWALGKGALFCGIVSGAAVYGAVEHRMSGKFQDVSFDEALLEVASAVDLGFTTMTAKAEIERRYGHDAVSAFAGPVPREDDRIAQIQDVLPWFDEQQITSLAVQDALARWGVFKHGDGYRIENLPAPSAELQPSPWALKSVIEEVAAQSGEAPAAAAEAIDRELTNFMISTDLCGAGSEEDCLIQMSDLEGRPVVIMADAKLGALMVLSDPAAATDSQPAMEM